ncbi:hypothetical protein [Streptomyces sp. NPDC059916]|uniref:hypothetical protein n=1 Tax=Streptomyces sp. NPDC059916 TaxID=3347001 RepID=UPI0036904383
MSILATTRTVARHRRLSRLELAAYIAQLEGQNTALIAGNTALAAQLDQAANDISGLSEDLRVARGENLRLDAALTATNARLANATSVGSLPQHVSTQPVPIVQRFESGPVLRAGASPLAAVTAPGKRGDVDKTQPLPVVTTT